MQYPHGFCPNCGTSVYARADEGEYAGVVAINIVVAAVRDPAHLTAQELAKLPTGEGSRIFVVKYDASIEQSAFDAVKEAIDQGVDHLDYVVANAGIANNYPFVKDVKWADILEQSR
ncbi:hypothetical protein PENSUB_14042 [Penicillium subrubescens]|uniref:CENP-V/GFA domain-containing protein n=1 Tax=Penicillium subrubescens TaxID=1316194 RepID=A0A1Q5UPM9_9EURO|nr:hypothetical protein PENSUB_14042 [Penicillium subrubescens]